MCILINNVVKLYKKYLMFDCAHYSAFTHYRLDMITYKNIVNLNDHRCN